MAEFLDAKGVLARKQAAEDLKAKAISWTEGALAEFEAASKLVGTKGIGLNAKIYGRDPIISENTISQTNDSRGEINWGYFVPILILSKHDDAQLNQLWGAAMGANGEPYFGGKRSSWSELATFIVSACNSGVGVVTQVLEAALLDEPWDVHASLNA
jgi:hypothetical protein